MLHIDDKIHEILVGCDTTVLVKYIFANNTFNFGLNRLFRPTQSVWGRDNTPDLHHPINLLHIVEDKIGYYTNTQIETFLRNTIIKNAHTSNVSDMPIIPACELLERISKEIKPTVAKPAKVFKKIIEDYTLTDQDYSIFGECYNNQYIKNTCRLDDITIVSGKVIETYYHQDNYYTTSGYLGDSCMRYPECQKYLGIYVDNINQIKMIVYLIDGKVAGRCLLWLDKYYDVIYSNYAYIKIAIEKFCEKQNYISTYAINHTEIIKLDHVHYNWYPYVDTFFYLDLGNKTVSNHQDYGKWSMRSLNGDKID